MLSCSRTRVLVLWFWFRFWLRYCGLLTCWVLIGFVADFTPVCTTELGMMAKYAPEFEKRGVKLLGLSCDDVESHKAWIKDVEAFTVISTALFNLNCYHETVVL